MKYALALFTASFLLAGSSFAEPADVTITLVPTKNATAKTEREPAAAPGCAVCRKADEITQLFRKDAEKGNDATEAFLEKLTFSKTQATRDEEILAVLKLCALVLPKDEQGTIDEYLYDAYVEHTSDFDHAISTLPAADQKVIKASIKNSKKVSDEGNG